MPKKVDGKTRGDTAFQDPATHAQGTDTVVRLKPGCLYPAIVRHTDLTTGMLHVVAQGELIMDCKYMACVSASYIGVQEVTLPPPGTNVALWYWPKGSYVLGTQGSIVEAGDDACWNPPITGDVDFDVLKEGGKPLQVEMETDKRDTSPVYQLPIDMLPGEWGQDTGIGPVIRLLYNFAQMSAGDLAKIEVHLINDMVRIVSNEFRHHHVGGDDLIWSDGWHNNREMHFTSYAFEAEGKQEENASFAEEKGEGVYENTSEDADPNMYSATGRWRYSTYIGFLGDMIHTWVTRPTEVISNTMDEAFRGCNFRQWVGQDGTFFIQAGTAVQIEVNNHLVVPAILKAYNDPEFNPQDQQLKLDASFLKVWGKGPMWEDLKVACWQMRTYLKYIPLWHSLERFKQMEQNGYCKIPTESEAPKFHPNAAEEDKTQQNSSNDEGTPYGYASLAMDLTGNVSLISNDHTSVIMSNGSVQIAAPGNVEIKAGGTVSLQGQNVIIHSAKNLEIMSFFGGIYSKARTCWNMLCEKGRIWLKSDGDMDDPTDPGNCPLEYEPEPDLKKNGIILDATKSKILTCGAKGVEVVSNQKEGHIKLHAEGAESNVCMYSTQHILMKAIQDIKTKCIHLALGGAITKICSGLTKIGDNVLIAGGTIINAGAIITTAVLANGGYVGPSEHNGKDPDMDPPDPSNEEADKISADIEDEDVKSKYREEEFEDSDWMLPAWKIPGGDDVKSPMSLKGSLLEDYAEDAEDVETMTIYDAMLEAAWRTSPKNYPWPGKDSNMFIAPSKGEKLTRPWDRQFSESDIGGEKDMTTYPYQFVFAKEEFKGT